MRASLTMAAQACLFVGLLAAFPAGAVASLTAGDVDDNLNFGAYIRYQQDPGAAADWTLMPALELQDRVTIRVTNETGIPVPHAVVTVTAPGLSETVKTLQAGSDGVLQFFPSFDGYPGISRFRLTLRDAGDRGAMTTAELTISKADVRREVPIEIPGTSTKAASALDLMMVIDTTGSMYDELDYLKDEFRNITAAINGANPSLLVRFGLVLYRDVGEEYVVRSYGFTSSAERVQGWLQSASSDYGGDYPEAMDRALGAAVASMWGASDTARVLFLVADAPPHAEGFGHMIEAAKAAREAGIHIFPVAASGADGTTEYLMRASALLTQGRYLFLTDDSRLGKSHAKPSAHCYVVTPLQSLVARVVESEVVGHRVEPSPEEIVRTVGNYTDGRCDGEGGSIRPQHVTSRSSAPRTGSASLGTPSGASGAPPASSAPVGASGEAGVSSAAGRVSAFSVGAILDEGGSDGVGSGRGPVPRFESGLSTDPSRMASSAPGAGEPRSSEGGSRSALFVAVIGGTSAAMVILAATLVSACRPWGTPRAKRGPRDKGLTRARPSRSRRP